MTNMAVAHCDECTPSLPSSPDAADAAMDMLLRLHNNVRAHAYLCPIRTWHAVCRPPRRCHNARIRRSIENKSLLTVHVHRVIEKGLVTTSLFCSACWRVHGFRSTRVILSNGLRQPHIRTNRLSWCRLWSTGERMTKRSRRLNTLATRLRCLTVSCQIARPICVFVYAQTSVCRHCSISTVT
jgi:hypothetical protein